MILIAHDQSAKVKQPGEEPLNLPPPPVTAQRTTILRGDASVDFIGRNHFRAEVLQQLFIQMVAVIRFVPDQTLRHLGHETLFQRLFHQCHFSRRSAFRPQGERKTMAVGNAHDLGALAPLGFPHQSPPFLAGTNVPSTKHSFKSKPPASLSCCASLSKSSSITPERTQFWKRRWAVWYGPYRGGRSCQGAPVRNIHKAPFNTLRRSLQGRPRPSFRTGSSGRMGSTIFHCLSVKSIHNYLYINYKGTSTKLYYL